MDILLPIKADIVSQNLIKDLEADHILLQKTALSIIVQHLNASANDHIINALSHSDPIVRKEAILAISKSDHASKIEKLNEHLGDEDWHVRHRAAECLYHLSNSEKKRIEDTRTSSETIKADVCKYVCAFEEGMQSCLRFIFEFFSIFHSTFF